MNHKKHSIRNHSMDPSSSSGGDSTGVIPEDMLFQILLRLPVSSLVLFRSVSKSWLSLIDNPDFVSQHADREGNNSLMVVDTGIGFSIISEDNLQLSQSFEFCPVVDGKDLCSYGTIVSSFNGIVCVVYPEMVDDYEGDIVFVLNPARKQSAILSPQPRIGIFEDSNREYSNWFNNYGFGFDDKTNDYKLVRVFIPYSSHYSTPPYSEITVCCLSTNSWRVIDAGVSLNFQLISNPKKPFMKEIYCWLGFDEVFRNYSVLSFDFTNEKFRILPVPEMDTVDIDDLYSEWVEIYGTKWNVELAFLREKIAIIDWVFQSSHRPGFKIWVLNEYGVKESWTKLYTVILDQVGKPFGFAIGESFGCSMNGKLISIKPRWLNSQNDWKIFLYDPLTQEVSVVTTPTNFDEVVVYKESLISIKSAIGVKNRANYEVTGLAHSYINDRVLDLQVRGQVIEDLTQELARVRLKLDLTRDEADRQRRDFEVRLSTTEAQLARTEACLAETPTGVPLDFFGGLDDQVAYYRGDVDALRDQVNTLHDEVARPRYQTQVHNQVVGSSVSNEECMRHSYARLVRYCDDHGLELPPHYRAP